MLALTVALTLAAAACGGSSDSGNDGGDGGGGGSDDPGTPVMGGELTYGLEAETGGGFCLTNAQLVISGIVIADAVYDTLVVPDETGEMVPFLAKAVTPNSDYTSWTIELRPGIMFHDGSPLDAEALKLNLDGYDKGILFQFALGPVEEIVVTGPLTVDVKMNEPWYKFPQTLWGWGRIGIMAPAQINSPDCATKMIGTGPFTLESRELNVKTVVKKNPNYWLTDKDGNKLPYLNQITFVPQPNATQRVNAFVSGSFNALHTNSAPQLETLDKTSDTTVTREPAGHREVSYGLLIQGPQSPFSNKNARLAVAHAIDMAKINTIVNLGKNTIAVGPFDEDVIGYTEDTGQPTYDADKAKSAAAAYKKDTGDDLEFRIATTNDPETRQIVELVIQDLKASGITATPVETDQGQLVNDALSKKFEMFWWRNHWGTDPDSQWLWWYSGSLPNFGQINDAEIDGYFEQGRVSSNDADRATTYEDLNTRMGSEAYNVWGWYANWAVATSSDVKGITGPNLPGTDGAPSDTLPYPIYAGWHLFSGTWIAK